MFVVKRKLRFEISLFLLSWAMLLFHFIRLNYSSCSYHFFLFIQFLKFSFDTILLDICRLFTTISEGKICTFIIVEFVLVSKGLDIVLPCILTNFIGQPMFGSSR